jgi:HEAT repeat protein
MTTASPNLVDPPHRPDERSIPELVAAALAGDEEDQKAWDAIMALQRRGDVPVFEAATKLLGSLSDKERGRGVEILAQLGTPNPSAELRAKCSDAILAALAGEQSPSVLHSIGVALGHLGDARAVAALLPFIDHRDPLVRFGVVLGLSPHPASAAVEGLIQLSVDPDEDVRNWATFGLGTMMDVDTPALRDALVQRLGDPNAEIRGEALVGLAQRKDERVLEPLRRELVGESVGVLAVEAAGSLGDLSLLPLLLELRNSVGTAGQYFDHILDGAIEVLERAEPAPK